MSFTKGSEEITGAKKLLIRRNAAAEPPYGDSRTLRGPADPDP